MRMHIRVPAHRLTCAPAEPHDERPSRLLKSRACVIVLMALAAAVLGGCTVPPTTKEPVITITAAEAATIAETTIRDAARAASLADKLRRDADPNTDDEPCYDSSGTKNGLVKITRAFTIEGLDTPVMLAGARAMRDHFAKNGWEITNDQSAPDPGLDIRGINDSNGLYLSIDAANHGILIMLSSGCLKPGALSSSPSTSAWKQPARDHH